MSRSQPQKSSPSPSRPSRQGQGWIFGWRKGGDLNRRAALAVGGLLVLIWLVGSFYLALSSYALLRARYVQGLREELLRLQQENALLEERIGERLFMVIQAVPQTGFVPATQIEVVDP
ncbi:MAG: hypothetical protein RMK65_00555 [Anaerolineae bacterium]|nr:hypothetical protein [Anaerolineae bacterium]MDW7990646.1 hypothetical protein [Anaerolineae bacterium]